MAIVCLFIAGGIVIIDQLLKYMAAQFLPGAGSVTAIPHLLNLVYVENRGAAFGVLQEQRWIFIVGTALLLAVFLYILFRKKLKDKLFIASAALIIGGGIGNLIDRVFLGYVVDYLQLSFFPPVCNFADYCITIGAVLLVIYILFFSTMAKEDEKKKFRKKRGAHSESGEPGE